MSLLDWAAKKVQNFSGETDRRENVAKLKETQASIIKLIKDSLEKLNALIQNFNFQITHLNEIRSQKVYHQVDGLQTQLKHFGRTKPIQTYIDEDRKSLDFKMPEKQLQSIDDYISSVDWDSKQVFDDSFLKGALGVHYEMNRLNQQITSQISQLNLYQQEIDNEFQLKNKQAELEIMVAKSYTAVIETIADEIQNRILPELSIIHSFMIAKHIADYGNHFKSAEEHEVLFSPLLLKNTEYEKYYQFLRNAFAFYIMAVRISTTPVLTNLLENRVTEADIESLKSAGRVVVSQQDRLNKYQVGNN